MSNGFKKGHPYHPPKDGKKAGRPPRAVEEQYMRTLVQAMPVDRFLKVCEVHAAQAEAGDLASFRLFVRHLIGTPKMRAEVTADVAMRLSVFYDELAKAIERGVPAQAGQGQKARKE